VTATDQPSLDLMTMMTYLVLVLAEVADSLCSSDKLVGVGVDQSRVWRIVSRVLLVRTLPEHDLQQGQL
jgi:hypothetical protein